MKEVTILINSCDLYVDTWEPQIELLYIQWSDCPYNIVINTESKEYKNDNYPLVKTYCSGKGLTWSQRFRRAISQIQSDYILFTIDDYFIQNPVNTKVFNHALELMEKNNKIGMICLSGSNKTGVQTNEYEDEYFYSRIIDEKNMIWCRMCLYRKDYLLKLIRDHETIWEFEKFCSYRAKKLPYIILQENSKHPEVFTFKVKVEEGYGITMKKWLPKNVELFNKYGIEVNFDNLGFLDTTATKKQVESQKDSNSIIERLYKIKHFFKKQKKKLIKFIRMLKSII